MDKHFSWSSFLPSATSHIQAFAAHRRSFATALLSTLLCSACNDFETAQNTQTRSSQAVSIETTVQALVDAGHPTLTLNNAKPVSDAPAGEGFTLEITQNNTAFTDSRLVTLLNGNAEVYGENAITQQLWLQRSGPAAFILNANTARATALLPQVKTPTTLSFSWLAADAQLYVDEQSTSVQLLGNAAPFSVTTRAQSELYSQVILEIALDAPATQTTRLHYQTQDGTAIANEDYLAMSGEIIFEAGQISRLIPVPLLSDLNRASANNEGDEYFSVLLSGTVKSFTGSVHGYGVIYNNPPQGADTPIIIGSATIQNTLAGSNGEQRVYLEQTNPSLTLSVNNRCTLSRNADCAEKPTQETGEGWANIAWPTAPSTLQSYQLLNTTDSPLDYVITVFDGAKTFEITGTAPANQRINVYTAFTETAGSSPDNGGSSSSIAPAPSTLQTTVKPSGLDATDLNLTITFDNNIAISSIAANLNGNSIAASTALSIPYAQLISGLNRLQISASDQAGNKLERTLQLYFGDAEINEFIGDGDTNIFIGQNGMDTFTGSDGTNIYLAGSQYTTYVAGTGENIFILQDGVSSPSIEAQGDFNDQIILPGATLASLLIRQTDESGFQLRTDSQSFSVVAFFTADGAIQSSIQRFIFADGELNAADIRRLIHAPSAGNDNYWGFNTDDTIIDTDGINSVYGGNGDDTLTLAGVAYGGAGDDIITSDHAEGGDGNDTIEAESANGGNGDDSITVTSFADGGAGDDIIYSSSTGKGGEGNDEVHAISAFGDAGNDILYTTGTNAFGGDGDDILHGNEGDNSLFGDAGNDKLYGYDGDDKLFSGEGHSTLDGGNGNDSLFASQGDFDDVLIGGNGDDKIWAYDGNNTVDAGPGDETIFIGNGNNVVDCGEGTHEIYGNDGGNDTITCGSGDDEIYLDQGNDELRAGAGSDNVYASGPSSNAVTAENFHAGNKDILLEDGDDELHLSDGLTCYVEGGDGVDSLYASCQHLTVDSGNGEDLMRVGASFQLSVTGGEGDDYINVSDSSSAPHASLATDTPYTHYYWSPGEGNDTYLLSGVHSFEEIDAATAERIAMRLNNSHFYLGGDSTLEKITFVKNDSSLLMQYNNADTNAQETLTFEYWFDYITGQGNARFNDFQLADNATIATSAINDYFNLYYHHSFDTGNNGTGLTREGIPMTSDQRVISQQSLLVDNQNYAIKQDHQFTASAWTLEFWLLPPAITPAVTPILQWGEMLEGIDGFGLALHNNGEGHEWRLQIGNESSVSVYDGSALDSPVHIAITFENQQLRLFVNGQPSSNALATAFTAETIAPLNFGYFNTNNAETAVWHLDELLITQESAKYNVPFMPDRNPTVLTYTP